MELGRTLLGQAGFLIVLDFVEEGVMFLAPRLGSGTLMPDAHLKRLSLQER